MEKPSYHVYEEGLKKKKILKVANTQSRRTKKPHINTDIKEINKTLFIWLFTDSNIMFQYGT